MYAYRRTRKEKKSRIPALLIILIIGLFVGYYMGSINETTIIYQNETRTSNIVTYIPYSMNGYDGNTSHVSVIIPAVIEEGEGVTTVLTVQALPGNGRILANIDRLLFWTDTQNSIRTSSKVASNMTGIDLSEYDIIYTIKTDAAAVEGPSAGAALTIATIAALENINIDTGVMITGSVNHDGTIGPVSEIIPKAMAAKAIGAHTLLVPLLQSQEIIYETSKYCEQIGNAQICSTETVPKKVDVSEEAGIKIIEVQDIQEALGYFLKEQ